MTLIQLRYLLAIVDSGLNISLAAGKIHATQPALSRQIKQLEDELGVVLFVRGARSLNSITAVGEKIVAHARLLLVEAANIRTIASQSRSDKSGLSATSDMPNHNFSHLWLHSRLGAESKSVVGAMPEDGKLQFEYPKN